MTEIPTKFGMGQPVRRKEDLPLIQGRGRYVADFAADGETQAYVLRSPHAHARFRIVDVEAARASPGVCLVLTAADVAELKPLPLKSPVKNGDGSPPKAPPYHVLAREVVRHVGDAIAFVVAETLDEAKSAAELIEVDWEPLDVVVDAVAAAKDGAPLVWPELGSNVALETAVGSGREEVEAAFSRAARVVRLELVNNRLVTNFMETRGVLAEYDAASERYTLVLGSQGSHSIRSILCRDVLGIPDDKMRVITPDVGGGFGTKIFVFREYPLAAIAAKRLGRPVRWIGERAESFVSDSQGRDNVSVAEVALDAEANFLAIRVETVANLGAYLNQFSTYIPYGGAHMVPGCYRTPLVRVEIKGVLTNTVPVDAYRGAGRPEASYLIERLVDLVASETGLSPAEVRRRNFVTPEEMPFTTPTGRIYDSGAFADHMQHALMRADQAGFEARRVESASAGRLRGFGFSSYIEACAGGSPESATIAIEKDGGATILIGTQTNGQGHITAYAQLAAAHLGLPMERISVHQGDTDRVARGGGTGGSRSVPIGGVAVDMASRSLAEKLRLRAADMLEADAGDLELAGGTVRIAGTDRAVSFAALAEAAGDDGLVAGEVFKPTENTYPNGTHVCELEVDPETGAVDILRYVVVDDFGATVNPLLLEGQVHGGIVQGIGQALHERTVYEADTGQLLTATLQDYCVPRADNAPTFSFETRNVPCATNPLGLKGAGEAGTIGACAAVINALVDALRPVTGLRHIDMPATPQAVWDALATYRDATSITKA